MRFRTVSVLGALLLLAFAVPAWSIPILTPAVSLVPSNPESHSIAGRISAVGDMQFSLDIQKNNQPNTMQFLTDEHTKLEGKLAVGAQASVDYRVEGDKMIATRIVVTPAAILNLH